MKRNYLTPAMTVMTIQCSQMVCDSVLCINNESANDGQPAWSKEEVDLIEEDLNDIFLGWE